MEDASNSKILSWGGFVGALVTLVTLVGGALAIKQYYDQNPEDISGTWIIQTQLGKTEYQRYNNLKLTYTVIIVQNGSSFTGNGEKTSEQEPNRPPHELQGKARVPIEIAGSVSRNSIDAGVTEHGTERESHGEFHWERKNGSWAGTFSSTAADSGGESFLKRP
jgi:hypothetical protein